MINIGSRDDQSLVVVINLTIKGLLSGKCYTYGDKSVYGVLKNNFEKKWIVREAEVGNFYEVGDVTRAVLIFLKLVWEDPKRVLPEIPRF